MISSSSMMRIEPLRAIQRAFESVGRARQPLGRRQRKAQREPGALTEAAVAVDGPVVLADDAIGNRQAETGALADGLGREERIVNTRKVLAGNAGAGIGHLD